MTKMMHPRKTRGIVAVRADATPPGDVKALVAELNKSFADFREANDERHAQAEKRLEDAVTVEKVEKINADISVTQDKLDEALKDLSNIKMSGLGSKDGNDRDFKNEATVFMSGKTGTPEARVTDVDVDVYREYDRTFAQFLKGGDREHAVQAAMQVGSDPDGGYWVPTQMLNDIRQRLFETSPMRQVASVMSITTDSVAFPTDTNDATSGGWVGETEARSVTDTPQVGEQTIYVREQYAQPKVTQKLLDMSTINVEGWLNAKIADKMVRTENTAFVSGAGVNKPRGFLDYKTDAVTTDDATRAWGKLQYVASGASGAFPTLSGSTASDPDSLITMVSKLKPAYRAGATWMMNRAAEATLRKLKDADGNYMIGNIKDGATGFQLLGFPIVTAEDMPDIAADSFSVAFGNFAQGYLIVDGRGIRILRDPYTDKPYVKFYTTKWTGGDVVDFDAIKLMKFAS